MSPPFDLSGAVPRPPHVYIPGQTKRHPEDWFDGIKATVTADVPVDRLHKTQAFICGQEWFEAGFFWECHEVLEAVWLRTATNTPEREIVQGLIQLANARLKLLMNRPRAALRLCDMVDVHLNLCPARRPVLGLDPQKLKALTGQTREKAGLISKNMNYNT